MNHEKEKCPIIAPEGVKLTIAFVVIALVFFFTGYYILFALTIFIVFFNLFFFRNPQREAPEGPFIVAPADGTVIRIKEVMEEEFFKEKVNMVSIFMSIFNVHINRAPCSGRVLDIRHNEGKFFSANLDLAVEENEKNYVFLELENGIKLLYCQVAGLIARRIVCDLKVGDKIKIGQRVGLICYGSRVDIFLPKEIKIKVKLNDKTKAGETILGEIINDQRKQ